MSSESTDDQSEDEYMNSSTSSSMVFQDQTQYKFPLPPHPTDKEIEGYIRIADQMAAAIQGHYNQISPGVYEITEANVYEQAREAFSYCAEICTTRYGVVKTFPQICFNAPKLPVNSCDQSEEPSDTDVEFEGITSPPNYISDSSYDTDIEYIDAPASPPYSTSTTTYDISQLINSDGHDYSNSDSPQTFRFKPTNLNHSNEAANDLNLSSTDASSIPPLQNHSTEIDAQNGQLYAAENEQSALVDTFQQTSPPQPPFQTEAVRQPPPPLYPPQQPLFQGFQPSVGTAFPPPAQGYPPQQPPFQGFQPSVGTAFPPPAQGYPPQQPLFQGFQPSVGTAFPPPAQGYPPQQPLFQGFQRSVGAAFPPPAQGYPPQQPPFQGFQPSFGAAFPPPPPSGYPPQQPPFQGLPPFGAAFPQPQVAIHQQTIPTTPPRPSIPGFSSNQPHPKSSSPPPQFGDPNNISPTTGGFPRPPDPGGDWSSSLHGNPSICNATSSEQISSDVPVRPDLLQNVKPYRPHNDYKKFAPHLEIFYLRFQEQHRFDLKLLQENFPTIPPSTLYDWENVFRKDESWRPYRNHWGEHRRLLNDAGEQQLSQTGISHSDNQEPWSTKMVIADAQDLSQDPRFGGPNSTGSFSRMWEQGFLDRNDFSYKEPRAIQVRNANYNPAIINTFVEQVNGAIETLGPNHVANFDEFSVKHHPALRLTISPIGLPNPQIKLPGNPKECFTMIGLITADGGVYPLSVIRSSRVSAKQFGNLDGIKMFKSQSGWMKGGVCLKYFKHMRSLLGNGVDDDVAIVMDRYPGHKTKVVARYATDHRMHIIWVPGGKTGLLQPLDRSVFGPLRSLINAHLNDRIEKGLPITRRAVLQVVKEAWAHIDIAALIEGWDFLPQMFAVHQIDVHQFLDPNSYFYHTSVSGSRNNTNWTTDEACIIINAIIGDKKPTHWGMMALQPGLEMHTGEQIRLKYTELRRALIQVDYIQPTHIASDVQSTATTDSDGGMAEEETVNEQDNAEEEEEEEEDVNEEEDTGPNLHLPDDAFGDDIDPSVIFIPVQDEPDLKDETSDSSDDETSDSSDDETSDSIDDPGTTSLRFRRNQCFVGAAFALFAMLPSSFQGLLLDPAVLSSPFLSALRDIGVALHNGNAASVVPAYRLFLALQAQAQVAHHQDPRWFRFHKEGDPAELISSIYQFTSEASFFDCFRIDTVARAFCKNCHLEFTSNQSSAVMFDLDPTQEPEFSDSLRSLAHEMIYDLGEEFCGQCNRQTHISHGVKLLAFPPCLLVHFVYPTNEDGSVVNGQGITITMIKTDILQIYRLRGLVMLHESYTVSDNDQSLSEDVDPDYVQNATTSPHPVQRHRTRHNVPAEHTVIFVRHYYYIHITDDQAITLDNTYVEPVGDAEYSDIIMIAAYDKQ